MPTVILGDIGISPVLLDQRSLTAANTYTTPTFTANYFRKIVIEFIGAANTGAAAGTTLGLVVNADTAAHYGDIGYSNPAFLSSVLDAIGSLAYAKVGLWGAIGNNASTSFKTYIEFYPETLGFVRQGAVRASSGVGSATVLQLNADLSWSDTATDATSLTVKTITATDSLTGKIKVWGERA